MNHPYDGLNQISNHGPRSCPLDVHISHLTEQVLLGLNEDQLVGGGAAFPALLHLFLKEDGLDGIQIAGMDLADDAFLQFFQRTEAAPLLGSLAHHR